MSLLNLKEYQDTRVIVIGAVEGDYYKLIDFLYLQEFSYKDILILTGDFINFLDPNSSKIMQLIKESNNIFSIKGFSEKILVDSIEANKNIYTKFDMTEDDLTFLENLPLVVELNHNVYVVNSGYNPTVDITKQDPDYTIYKSNKVRKDDWFNYEQQASIFCFTHSGLKEVKVPGGYNLGSSTTDLHALILYKDADPILITV